MQHDAWMHREDWGLSGDCEIIMIGTLIPSSLMSGTYDPLAARGQYIMWINRGITRAVIELRTASKTIDSKTAISRFRRKNSCSDRSENGIKWLIPWHLMPLLNLFSYLKNSYFYPGMFTVTYHIAVPITATHWLTILLDQFRWSWLKIKPESTILYAYIAEDTPTISGTSIE